MRMSLEEIFLQVTTDETQDAPASQPERPRPGTDAGDGQ